MSNATLCTDKTTRRWRAAGGMLHSRTRCREPPAQRTEVPHSEILHLAPQFSHFKISSAALLTQSCGFLPFEPQLSFSFEMLFPHF